MRRWMVTLGCRAALLAVGTSASAQTAPVYVSGGYSAGWRQPPAIGHDEPVPRVVHNLVLAAGARITPWLGVEGSFALSLTEQSLAWKQLYKCCYEQVTSDRDATALVYFRFAPACEHRICVEGLAGTGFNVHHVEDLTVAAASILTPTIWVPVSGATPTITNGLEWTMAFGADFPVALSQHFTLAPTVRILMMKRPEFLTGWDFRGPASGSGFIPNVGVSLTWHAGARR